MSNLLGDGCALIIPNISIYEQYIGRYTNLEDLSIQYESPGYPTTQYENFPIDMNPISNI